MGKFMSSNEVVKKTLTAIKESQKLYLEFSGNEWLCNAPEYFITVQIAQKLHLPNENYITLEDDVDYILTEANALDRKKIRKGRFDIVVWWGNGTPRVIIEVKNDVSQYRNIAQDVERVKKVLSKNTKYSSIQFGLIAFYISKHYISKNPNDEMEALIKNLFQKTKDNIPNCKVSKNYEIIYDDNQPNDIYATVIFKIQK
ncbi:MAG: hypothetical protein U9N49_11580 [Campylobacterota bacterium]|nr:hypothetical protein [Campylobacterota bacterium]